MATDDVIIKDPIIIVLTVCQVMMKKNAAVGHHKSTGLT